MKHRTGLAVLAFVTFANAGRTQTADVRLEGTKVVAFVKGMVPTHVENDLTQQSSTVTTKQAMGAIPLGDAKAGLFVVRFHDERQSITKLLLLEKDPVSGKFTLQELGSAAQAPSTKPAKEVAAAVSAWKKFWNGIDDAVVKEAAKRTGKSMITTTALQLPVYVLTCGPLAGAPPLFVACTAKEAAGLAAEAAKTMLEHTIDVLVEAKKLEATEGKHLKTLVKAMDVINILLSPEKLADKAIGTVFGVADVAMDWTNASEKVRTGADVTEAGIKKWRAAIDLVRK